MTGPNQTAEPWHDISSFPRDGGLVMVQSSGTGPWPVLARWADDRVALLTPRLGRPERWRYMIEEVDV